MIKLIKKYLSPDTQLKLRIYHNVEPSDATTQVSGIKQLQAEKEEDRQIRLDLRSTDAKTRENAKKRDAERKKRKAINTQKEKNKIGRHNDPSQSQLTKSELNLINVGSEIAAEHNAHVNNPYQLKNSEPQYFNSKQAADLARARQNLLTEAYITNSGGATGPGNIYLNLNPYSPEGQYRLNFASANTGTSMLLSIGTGMAGTGIGGLYLSSGILPTVLTTSYGLAGDYAFRNWFGGDNPYQQAAAGAVGGAIGGYIGNGVVPRTLYAAMTSTSSPEGPLSKWPSELRKYIIKNIPYVLIGFPRFTGKYNGVGLRLNNGKDLKITDLPRAYAFGVPPGNYAKLTSVEELNPILQQLLLERFPNKDITVWQTAGPEGAEIYTGEIPNNYNTKMVEYDPTAPLFSDLNEYLNVRGHHVDYFRDPKTGRTVLRSSDSWNFHPTKYREKWLNFDTASPTEKKLLNFGLLFVNKYGHHIVVVEPWHYSDTRPVDDMFLFDDIDIKK